MIAHVHAPRACLVWCRYFHWLVYFPGNKIPSSEWNEDLKGCPTSAGDEDIPFI